MRFGETTFSFYKNETDAPLIYLNNTQVTISASEIFNITKEATVQIPWPYQVNLTPLLFLLYTQFLLFIVHGASTAHAVEHFLYSWAVWNQFVFGIQLLRSCTPYLGWAVRESKLQLQFRRRRYCSGDRVAGWYQWLWRDMYAFLVPTSTHFFLVLLAVLNLFYV